MLWTKAHAIGYWRSQAEMRNETPIPPVNFSVTQFLAPTDQQEHQAVVLSLKNLGRTT